MKKQAKMMQDQMSEVKQQMQSKLVEGTAGNGLVSIVLNGEKELKKIQIHPDCVTKDDVEGLQDLILAAFQDALDKVEKETPSSIPGLPFSF